MILGKKSRLKSPKTVENLASSLLLAKQSPSSKKGAKKDNLDYAHTFMEFKNVLQGQNKTAWKQVVHEHFLEPTCPENVPVKQDCSSETNFRCAMEIFTIKVLHKKKPRDWQYIYMMPSGNQKVQKKIKTSPIDKSRACYPRGTSRCPTHNYRWNGFI
jgi:hypothetical protein